MFRQVPVKRCIHNLFKPEKVYRHYKGELYHTIDLSVIHTETDERLVLYYNPKNQNQWFVRPFHMFFGQVEHQGKFVDRFSIDIKK